ncbi:AraC family ligand binding domain-containing protein [Sphingosinicella xenopeptidilytica]|uniref:AraC family ligand binding domain-containing protein n=2 Tax=Sphingosinicella xenopeptidilytica TaxID=364098 RepID=A0ABW3BYC1_SPHXN
MKNTSATQKEAVFRRAAEHEVELPPQPGQVHRASMGRIIDYRLQETTNDMVRAIATLPGHFEAIPKWGSPWHYHECDLQIALILKGSLDIAYEHETFSRASQGDILFIPGHVLHDVGGASSDYQVAEITFPGSFGTIEADPPEPDLKSRGATLAIRDARLIGEYDGLAIYRYALAEALGSQYAIRRYVRRRAEASHGVWQQHADRYRMLFVTQGKVTVEVNGNRPAILKALDIAIIPGDADYRYLSPSVEYEAVEVALGK